VTFAPLNEDQVRLLLAVAMTYDHRNPGESDVLAWMEAARRARWRFVPAREAIHEHYAQKRDFIMPGDITQRLKVESRFPPRFGEAPAELEEVRPDPAGQARIRQVVTALADRMGWPRKAANDDPALAVECPFCHAAPRRQCARLATRGPHRGEYVALSKPHPSRAELATKEAS
jgi:hypothetical protein